MPHAEERTKPRPPPPHTHTHTPAFAPLIGGFFPAPTFAFRTACLMPPRRLTCPPTSTRPASQAATVRAFSLPRLCPRTVLPVAQVPSLAHTHGITAAAALRRPAPRRALRRRRALWLPGRRSEAQRRRRGLCGGEHTHHRGHPAVRHCGAQPTHTRTLTAHLGVCVCVCVCCGQGLLRLRLRGACS